jgi:hypothetical protein
MREIGRWWRLCIAVEGVAAERASENSCLWLAGPVHLHEVPYSE